MSAPGRPRVSMIAAMSRNGAIGRDGTLPWRLAADMRHFVRLTRGKPVISGRRNHDDIGRALPGRHHVVLTRNRDYAAPGCTLAHDADAALRAAGAVDEVMVIGGETIYRAFLPLARRIYLTVVEVDIDGDTSFPALDPHAWRETGREPRVADEDNPFAMTFLQYDRVD